MFKKLNLKTKIISSITLASLFLCILVAVIIYFYLEKNLINEKLLNINKLNIEQVHESDKIFRADQTFAKMLSSETKLKEYLLNQSEVKRVELLNIFSKYAKEDSKYLSLFLLDKKGIALVSTDPTFVGVDYSFRNYYKEGIEGRPTADLLLGKISNQFGYFFSYPVFDSNKNVIGVFVEKINSEEIDNAILASEIAKESEVMLVDKYGVVLTSSRPDRFLKSLGELSLGEKSKIKESKKFLDKEINPLQYNQAQEIIRKGESVQGLKINDKEDGEVEIFNISKIGEYPFYLVSETGLETIRETVFFLVLIFLAMMILGVILSSFVIYRLVIFALSPLKDLKLFAQNISSGDFSKRVDIETKDEFGDLAHAFNSMADKLEDLYKNLEKKVKERTDKLEESENILKKTLNNSERVNKLMVGRELEMIKLKKELSDVKIKEK